MKRVLTNNTIVTLNARWDIDIYPRNVVTAASILDTRSNEYQSFIKSMVMQFEEYGYELYNDPEYTHVSNKGSQSWYYTFLKIEDQVEIRIIVNVGVSDHSNKDRPWGTADDRRSKYLKKVADELSDEYELATKPLRILVDIVFNDENYTSYHGAMFAIHDELEDLEAQYQQWRKDNNLS